MLDIHVVRIPDNCRMHTFESLHPDVDVVRDIANDIISPTQDFMLPNWPLCLAPV